ncbi:transmembrane protein 119b [Rhinoraja longicauda]
MAVWLVLWQLVLANMCLCAPMTPNVPDVRTPSSAEASGSYESAVTSTEEPFSTVRSSDIDTTDAALTSTLAVTASKSAHIGTVVKEFIMQYLTFIIIAAVALVLLLVLVCTVIFTRLSKGSAYYPSSYPTKKYVDKQDKRGSGKNFEEVAGTVGEEPKEDMVNTSEQLQSDILSASHNLKKKGPSKGNEKKAGKGESPQEAGKEGGNSTAPDSATNAEGPLTGGMESNSAKAPEGDRQEEEEEQPTGKEEQKGDGQAVGKGKRENEEVGKDKMEMETGAVPGTISIEPSSSEMRDKFPQAPGEQLVAGTDQSNTLDGAAGQELNKVKYAQLTLYDASSVAEPSADYSKDLEGTPLISKSNGAPNDNRAF